MTRALVAVAVVASLALACGRTDLVDEGNADASVREPAPVQREAPAFVFTGGPCPDAGVESDLRLVESGERLVLAKTQRQEECSGAGGEYLMGATESLDVFVGAHTCYFAPQALRNDQTWWGVVRVNQTAALFHAPKEWCITSLQTGGEATSSVIVRAWALYRTEEGAKAARAAYAR